MCVHVCNLKGFTGSGPLSSSKMTVERRLSGSITAALVPNAAHDSCGGSVSVDNDKKDHFCTASDSVPPPKTLRPADAPPLSLIEADVLTPPTGLSSPQIIPVPLPPLPPVKSPYPPISSSLCSPQSSTETSFVDDNVGGLMGNPSDPLP